MKKTYPRPVQPSSFCKDCGKLKMSNKGNLCRGCCNKQRKGGAWSFQSTRRFKRGETPIKMTLREDDHFKDMDEDEIRFEDVDRRDIE